MKNGSRIVKEFSIQKTVRRAGFVPGFEQEIETWQVWCHKSDGEESRRATRSDMRSAGYKKRGKK